MADGWQTEHKLYLDYIERERLMGIYGDPLDIDPHTALLKEVQRTAGHVEWLRQIVDDIHRAKEQAGADNAIDRTLLQYTPLGIQPSAWIQLYQEERRHLLRACSEAIKAGVAERTVQIAQDQARTLALILKAFLMAAEMHWTPEQRIKAPSIIRELISNVPNQDALAEVPMIAGAIEAEAKAVATPPKAKRGSKK